MCAFLSVQWGVIFRTIVVSIINVSSYNNIYINQPFVIKIPKHFDAIRPSAVRRLLQTFIYKRLCIFRILKDIRSYGHNNHFSLQKCAKLKTWLRFQTRLYHDKRWYVHLTHRNPIVKSRFSLVGPSALYQQGKGWVRVNTFRSWTDITLTWRNSQKKRL